jgi:hypothetical protein
VFHARVRNVPLQNWDWEGHMDPVASGYALTELVHVHPALD